MLLHVHFSPKIKGEFSPFTCPLLAALLLSLKFFIVISMNFRATPVGVIQSMSFHVPRVKSRETLLNHRKFSKDKNELNNTYSPTCFILLTLFHLPLLFKQRSRSLVTLSW